MNEYEKVLSYHDVLLRAKDVELLRSPTTFLNDQIIEFYFEYLSKEQFPGLKDVAFLGASTTLLISQSPPSELKVLLEPLGLSRKRVVFLAVNNNPEVDLPGGSHWSLLTFDKENSEFSHYDSLQGTNRARARELVAGLVPLLEVEPPYWIVESEDAPQQCNGHDCGLYVLAVAEKLCGVCGNSGSEKEQKAALADVSSGYASGLRKTILELITRKAQGG